MPDARGRRQAPRPRRRARARRGRRCSPRRRRPPPARPTAPRRPHARRPPGRARPRGRAPRRRRSPAARDPTRPRHPLVVDLEPADEDGQRAQRPAHVAARGEHRRLVLLQVAVVRERQALHDREQPGEPADRRARLAAHQLGHVRVELLRHRRGAGRRVLRQPDEAELRGAPEHDLLPDPGEVAEQHGARVQVVEREVPVGDGVERVPRLRAGRRRERQGRAGQRSRAEGLGPACSAAWAKRTRSRSSISTQARRWWPSVTGCARWRCV